MKRILAALMLLALAGAASAEPRRLGGFEQVNASGRFRVEVSVGPAFSVSVDGPDAARISTRVDGDTLKIAPTRRPWFSGEPSYDATVRVTLPRFEGAAAARGAIFDAVGGGECVNFDAAAAMGAALTVRDLYCASVDASAAMGGEIVLAGACRNLDVAAAMGGTVNASALRCGAVDASAAMGGEIEAFANQTYEASAAMGGSVNIAGGGRATDRSTAMGGSITPRP